MKIGNSVDGREHRIVYGTNTRYVKSKTTARHYIETVMRTQTKEVEKNLKRTYSNSGPEQMTAWRAMRQAVRNTWLHRKAT